MLITQVKGIFAAIVMCVALTVTAEPVVLNLIFLQSVANDAPDGEAVLLQSLDTDRCKYMGAMKSAIHTDNGLIDKVISSAAGRVNRSINVTRKICGEHTETASFQIELGRMRTFHSAGTKVTVLTTK
jgi:hypothetical protein